MLLTPVDPVRSHQSETSKVSRVLSTKISCKFIVQIQDKQAFLHLTMDNQMEKALSVHRLKARGKIESFGYEETPVSKHTKCE